MTQVSRKGFRDKNGKQVVLKDPTKADKVENATTGNLASLDENGNLQDSGYATSDFAPAKGSTEYADANHSHNIISSGEYGNAKAQVGTQVITGDGGKAYVFVSKWIDGVLQQKQAFVQYDNIDNLIRALKDPDTTPTASSDNLLTSGVIKTALDGKAASVHSHAISDVTGLQTALDSKMTAASSSVNLVYDSEDGWTVEGDSVLQNMSWDTVTPLWFNLQVALQGETIKAKILGSAYKYLGGQDDTLILDFVVDGKLFEFAYQGSTEQDAYSYQFDRSENVTLRTTNIFPSGS